MSKPVKINIIQPCSESWDQMKEEGKGRFCENCKKTIVDFSALSDQELYTYFSNNRATTCGRFHDEQLNKNIFPLTNKYPFFNRFSKAAAALLTILSLRSEAAVTARKQMPVSLQPVYDKYSKGDHPVNSIISGQVQDENRKNLENATIMIGDSVVAVTDSEGKFSFELKDATKPLIIRVTCPGMVTVARSYHPAMQSTTYNIVLEAVIHENYTMGIFLPDPKDMPSVSIDLGKNSRALSEETKTSLANLATWMRNHPEFHVRLNTYISHSKETTTAKKIQSAVVTYLSDMEGIAEERLATEIQVVTTVKKSLLEIIVFYP